MGLMAQALLFVPLGLFTFSIGFFYGTARLRFAPRLADVTQDPPGGVVSQEALRVTDHFIKLHDLAQLEELVTKASGWPAVPTLTKEVLPDRQSAMQELEHRVASMIEASRLSLTEDRYEQAREAFGLLNRSLAITEANLFELLQMAVAKRPEDHGSNASTAQTKGGDADADKDGVAEDAEGDLLAVRVESKPFGMHIREGTTSVVEVFPGFPAQRLGVRAGCKLVEVAGKDALPGTWVAVFQETPLPFELKLNCNAASGAKRSAGPLSEDPFRYRVIVVKKPFGMNIQVNTVPRVVEVLPGYPAEAAGVRAGFVLTEVDNRPVSEKNWFEAFQSAMPPFTLTFNTTVPVHAGNRFLPPGANLSGAAPVATGGPALRGRKDGAATGKQPAPTLAPLPDEEYEDFSCEVRKEGAFGMQVSAPLDGRPTVTGVLPEMPAAEQGIRLGDVLVEVAGRSVTSATWFSAYQQAAPPFGLRFRRRRAGGSAAAAGASDSSSRSGQS